MNSQALQQFADRLGRFFAENGLPPMAGRLVAHLLTCEPAEQTFEELIDAVRASRSTVSVGTRMLVQVGLVERFGVSEDRRDRYRLHADAWAHMLEQDIAAASRLKILADEGLRAMGQRSVRARSRLRDMRAFHAFLEAEYAPILARWKKRSAKSSPG